METSNQPLETVVQVPIGALMESPTNPRKFRDVAKDAELVESIKTSGIQQPLILRSLGIVGRDRDKFEIVAGSRRYRAAKTAALDTVPAIVRELNDDQARELQQVENLQREDVHPLDEAAGFAELVRYFSGDIVRVALRVGKAESYIRQRMKLCELGKAGRDALAKGRILLSGAERLARIPEKQQADILVHYQHFSTIRTADIDERIKREYFLDLHAAPWPKDDASLVSAAGACTACPKRTGFTPSLFPDVTKKDTCTDAGCFKLKGGAWIDRELEAAKAAGGSLRLVSSDYSYRGGHRKSAKNILFRHSYQEVKGKNGRCAHIEKAIVADGEGLGRLLQVCAEKKCEVHGLRNTSFDDGAYKRRQAAERAKATVDAAVGVAILDAVLAKARAVTRKVNVDEKRLRAIAKHIEHRMEHNDRMEFCKRKGLEPVIVKYSYGYHKDFEAPLVAYIDRQPAAELVPLCLEMSLYGRARIVVGSQYRGELQKGFYDYAKSEGVDAAKIERQVRAEFAAKTKAKKAKGKAVKAKGGKEVNTMAAKAKKKPASKKKSAKAVKAAEKLKA